MDAHAAKLTDGVKALMKKYPDFRIDVYPTHRSAAAPQWVYDNTFKNATRAKLVDGGQGTEGAYGGTPFPIPKDGYEVFQNHRLAWVGSYVQTPVRVWVVTGDGKRAMASGGTQSFRKQFYDPEGSIEKFDGYAGLGKFAVSEPGSKSGEAILAHDALNASNPRGLWQYLVGQRRVRKAPSVAYDTPDSVTSGIGLFDEAFMLFGPIDKHELKLVGKKEIYIPYNNNKAASAPVAGSGDTQYAQPGAGALGAAPRVGSRGHIGCGQTPCGAQAQVLHRRRQLADHVVRRLGCQG